MPDETITPEPTHEPPSTATDTPEVQPGPIGTQLRARDIGLAAIVFTATLILLVGTTGLLQRGASSANSASPGPASSPAQASAGESPGGSPTTPLGSPRAAPSMDGSSGPPGDPVLVGAGDIGDCETSGDEETAKLLDAIPGTVFTAGDNAYKEGTADQFRDCYHPNWGHHRDRTRPA